MNIDLHGWISILSNTLLFLKFTAPVWLPLLALKIVVRIARPNLRKKAIYVTTYNNRRPHNAPVLVVLPRLSVRPDRNGSKLERIGREYTATGSGDRFSGRRHSTSRIRDY